MDNDSNRRHWRRNRILGARVFEGEAPISWTAPTSACGTANPHRLSGVALRQVDERWRHWKSRSGWESQEAKHPFANCERRPKCVPRLGQGRVTNYSPAQVFHYGLDIGLIARSPSRQRSAS